MKKYRKLSLVLMATPGKLILSFLWLIGGMMAAEVKIVYLPEEITIDEKASREIKVKNLSDQEIYNKGFLYIYDDFIYYQDPQTVELFKLDLQGNVIKRLKKPGEGPGEFVSFMGMQEIKGEILFLDSDRAKLLVYTKDFYFARETQMKEVFMGLFINKYNEIVFYSKCGNYLGYYFYVYSENAVKHLRHFGKTNTTVADLMKKYVFDSVRKVLYLPEVDGIWASFANRYDLRYYEKEKLKVEIKAPKDFFKAEEMEMSGRKIRKCLDRSACLARFKNYLFHLYTKDKITFCDIIDMSNYTLVKRVKLKRNYWYSVVHWKESIFYGADNDADSENDDVILYRIEIKCPHLTNKQKTGGKP